MASRAIVAVCEASVAALERGAQQFPQAVFWQAMRRASRERCVIARAMVAVRDEVAGGTLPQSIREVCQRYHGLPDGDFASLADLAACDRDATRAMREVVTRVDRGDAARRELATAVADFQVTADDLRARLVQLRRYA